LDFVRFTGGARKEMAINVHCFKSIFSVNVAGFANRMLSVFKPYFTVGKTWVYCTKFDKKMA
jgi:hypothetical protein